MSKLQIKYCFFFFFLFASFAFAGCGKKINSHPENEDYKDVPFIQETHVGYKISDNADDNEVRSIAVDKQSNVWVATAAGIFRKSAESRKWDEIITGENKGPAYSVVIAEDGTVLFGTWNCLYSYANLQLKKEEGLVPPISVICTSGNETFALGPNGIWQHSENGWKQLNYPIARSVRCAETDGKGSLWVGTDAGIYFCKNGKSTLYQNTNELISAYVRAIGFAPNGNCWVGTMGGVAVRNDEKLQKKITPAEGLSNSFVTCIVPSPDGTMWIGTELGIVRFDREYKPSLRFSRRWLMNDKVNDIAFDNEGNAWVATNGGVSQIKRNTMTLAEKEKDFYHQLMYRHIREPWTCGSVYLEIPGDTASWRHEDDDNDGEYTGGYLAMESFRYATTKSEDAHTKARKAFDFLRQLQTVTRTAGFFARSIVPPTWNKLHDGNRTYTPQQIADELVKDPRYKPVENRWRLSADGKWLWKGDTSTDEMDGHFMAYFYFYEYAANDQEKQMVRDHVRKIIDELIRNNYNLVDIDGTHTHWAVWSPDQINRDPDWASEKSLNSMELLGYLKFAYGITGDEKYQKEYLRLIEKEGYLENARKVNEKNPAWQIYFDRTLEGYTFPVLFRYETDPKIKAVYTEMLEKWMADQESGENLINNLAYTLCTGKKINTEQTIDFLKDAPLDLVEWPIDHSLREDVKLVRYPIMEEVQIDKLPPASMRATVRWDKNPWSARQGNLHAMREPVFWLWPYWEARYLGIIQ